MERLNRKEWWQIILGSGFLGIVVAVLVEICIFIVFKLLGTETIKILYHYAFIITGVSVFLLFFCFSVFCEYINTKIQNEFGRETDK